MFVSIAENCIPDELSLFYAESPLGPWTPHPRNPVKSDVRGSRPAGGLFEWNVVAGPDSRIMMAGSGVAWHMLALALIARFSSPEDAMQVARVNLLSMIDASPLAFASLTRGGRADDELVARCQLWAASNYREESPVTQMVALSGLPERTFKRRFQRATGMSALDYVQTLRLEEAKQMLEAGKMPVDEIALEVGYQDSSFFSRLFKRKVALTPAQYRRRFGALGEQLRRVAQP
jgi:transcriptional regulator GlxA family with amidase domain